MHLQGKILAVITLFMPLNELYDAGRNFACVLRWEKKSQGAGSVTGTVGAAEGPCEQMQALGARHWHLEVREMLCHAGIAVTAFRITTVCCTQGWPCIPQSTIYLSAGSAPFYADTSHRSAEIKWSVHLRDTLLFQKMGRKFNSGSTLKALEEWCALWWVQWTTFLSTL